MGKSSMSRWGRARSALVASLLGVALTATPSVAQGPVVLASAQVVTWPDRPPVLRLLVSAPAAFEVVPADDAAAASGVIVVRLIGVERAEMPAGESLAPFVLTTTRGPGYLDVAVAGPVPEGHALAARSGRQPHEVEIVVAPR